MSEQPAPAPVSGRTVNGITDSVRSVSGSPVAENTGPGSAAPADTLPAGLAAALKRDSAGLVAAIVQQFDTNEVLMLGWMDDEALRRTMTSGRVTFYSRSRQEYWRKGDTSGHVQWVKSLAMDCDGDALLVRVDQVGAACHTGTRTCFDGRGLDVVTGHAD
ncbi:phosphoribosyl-AMP cyclohydrolase [Arthrobacter sp. PsM3]|uniref:phosphoribosyl-AMP cyclohydrolase n=1 Tax=Arthrobacter sp. PsM3 TaxID=3030531 RepID=UPI00263A87BF|nr:phosphoribosyl-AMP cyclohydrolase [Arthrobacter sp. PsM3]MDN4643314.1 phosphoribosyl-AMP cyclohydrolase [Arthrobacter sp. PsM3]